MKIGILDYKACNLGSVFSSLYKLGIDPIIINSSKKISKLDRLIIPGVGAAKNCMEYLKYNSFIEPIKEFLSNKLNIVVGYATFKIFSIPLRKIYIDQINNYLLANLKPLNATLLTYYYNNNGKIFGHAVVIRRTIFNTIFVNDLQDGTQKLITDYLIDDSRIKEIHLYFTRQNPNRINVDVDLNKLVVPKLGGKRIKKSIPLRRLKMDLRKIKK